jgi:PAS domain S-box-containing protein
MTRSDRNGYSTDFPPELLQQTPQLLDRALASSSCGITVADARLPDQPLIYVNAAFERITGYAIQEVVGTNCRFLQGPERNQHDHGELRAALKDGRDTTVVLRNFRKDGRPFWNELIISPVFDTERTVTHFIGVQTDITTRKEAEVALRLAHDELEQRVQERTAELREAYEKTLEGWVKALDIRDHETEGHTQRVTAMALRLAETLGMDQAELANIRRGALLHDVGKIGIPDSVLLKPAALSHDERAVMEQHPVYAYDWLFPIPYLRPAMAIPHCHHEKWDGTGYPRGLKGEQIPLAARLFALVDVWDALSCDRPYRTAWTQERVIEHIRALAGTHFDPSLVEVFVHLLARDFGQQQREKKAA